MDTETPPEQRQDQAEQNGLAAGSSILDDVRALREKRTHEDSRRLDLDVPGYEKRLAVLYAYPADGYARAVKAIEREQGSEPNARLDGACDLLCACCLSVVGRNAEGALVDLKTNEPIGEGRPTNVYRFDRTLAEALQIDVPPEVKAVGRHVVRQVFSPRGAATGVYEGDLALISTSNIVFNWLNGAEVQVDEEVSGE